MQPTDSNSPAPLPTSFQEGGKGALIHMIYKKKNPLRLHYIALSEQKKHKNPPFADGFFK